MDEACIRSAADVRMDSFAYFNLRTVVVINFLILTMWVSLYLHCVEKLFVNHCKPSNTSVNHMTAEIYEGVLIRRSLGANNHFISGVTFEWCSNHLV